MRLLGVNIPDNKLITTALTYIYGIGPSRAKEIVAAIVIDPAKRASNLTASELNAIKEYIEKKFKIEGELKFLVKKNISLLKELQAYRGFRHSRQLPVRGQRTKTNSRTTRGNVRKTAGSGKRKVELK